MIKSLIKSTNEIRVETKSDCDELRKSVYQDAKEQSYDVTGWTESLKQKKEKGEVVEEWYICKYTLTFNDPKEPETFLSDIVYNMMEHIEEQNDMPW